MPSTLIFIILALVSTGLMVYAILLTARIFRLFPRSGYLKLWKLLLALITGFAICNFIFTLVISERGPDPLLQLVAVVLFVCAVFILFTLKLFMHTFIATGKVNSLHKDNILDEKTGTYYLRYFDMRLQQEFERSRRYSIPMTLLLVEVDNFRETTSSHGHNISEKALCRVCRILKDHSRSSDILARYGSDQLIIMLPNTALFNARKAAEKYRATVEDKVLDVDVDDDGKPVQLNFTLSIGISSLYDDVKRPGELIRRADMALYKAKDRGRNRAVIYGE